MAGRDVTVRIGADGQAQVLTDSGNPLNQGGVNSNAMVYSGGQPTAMAQGYRVPLPDGQYVTFATEADYLKANTYVRSLQQQTQSGGQVLGGQQGPMLGGSSGSRAGDWLRIGGDAVETTTRFFQGRALERKLEDLDETFDRLTAAKTKLEGLRASHPDLVPILLEILDAEREATITGQEVIEDEISAVDLQAGAGVAKVVGGFLDGSSQSSQGMSTGSMLALGGGVLGVGLLASRGRSSSRRSRRF